MIYGLYTSAAGAFVQTKKVETIANNVANVNTHGFRKDFLTLMERPAEVNEPGESPSPKFLYRNPILDKLGGGPHFLRSYFDKEPGSIQQTGRKLDVALRAKDGFMAVRQDVGNGEETLYTRAGNFYLDENGWLHNASGDGLVLSSSGEPIQLLTEDVIIDDQGNITIGNEAVQIGVFDFDDYTQLEKVGDTLFRPMGGMRVRESDVKIQQGFLEGSSTEPVAEMSDMIAAMRAYESNVRLMQQQDTSLERLISTIGRTA